MKTTAISLGLCLGLAASISLATSPVEAKPGGCLKYGAAGAVAGHYVKNKNGHRHGVKGFIAGCATGMIVRHEYNKKMREQKKLEEQQKLHPTAAPAPSATPPAKSDTD